MRLRHPAVLTGIVLAALWLALIGMVIAVSSSAGGTRWSLQLAQRLAPGLQFEHVDGTWLHGLRIGALRWRDADIEIALDDLQLRMHWPALLHGQLKVTPLHASQLTIELKGPDSNTPVELPRLELPLSLSVPDLALQKLRIVDGETVFELLDLRTAATWSGTTLRLQNTHLRWEETTLAASGDLNFRADYPLQLLGEIRTPQLAEPVAIKAGGDLRRLLLAVDTPAPWPLHADLTLATLDTNLPLSGQVVLTKPGVELVPQLEMTAQSGSLELRGDLTSIDGNLQLAIAEPRYGASKLSAALQWQPAQLHANSSLNLPSGDLQSDCTVKLADDIEWNCRAAANAIPLTPLLPQVDGTLSGPIQLDGAWRADQLALTLELPAIEGRLGADALRGQLQLSTEDGAQWLLPQLSLGAGPNQLQLKGRFGTNNQLQLDLAANDLNRLGAELGGALSGTVTLDGSQSAPSVRGQLRGEHLRYQDSSVARANLVFALPRLGLDNSRIHVELRNAIVAQQPAFDATLTSSGDRSQQRSTLLVQQQKNRVDLQCTTRSAAPYEDWQLDCPLLQASVHADRYSSDWRNSNALRGSWKGAPQRFELAPFCLGADDAALCLDTALRVEQKQLRAFSVHGRALPVKSLKPWLPDNLRLDNDARASLQADLKSAAPLQLQANVNIPVTEWSWRTTDKRQRATINDIAFALQFNERNAQLQASATSPTVGDVTAHLSVREPRGARSLDGSIELKRIQVAGLAWLVDGLDSIGGQLDGSVRIGGTAAAPQLHGQLRLQDGTANWAPLGAPFRNVHANLDFDNNNARLGGWFALGQGGGDIDGSASWIGTGTDWQAQLRLVAGGISAAPLPQSSIVLSPHIDLTAKPNEVRVKGFVDVASAEIRMKELPPETIDVSQDAHIVGQQQPKNELQLWADIGINLGDQFHFLGLGADVNLTGRLRLEQQPGDLPHLTGEVAIPKGRYRAYGQRLSVRRGSFIFYGPWDNPDLNLEAVREMPPGVTDVVGMRIIGSLKTPEAILFSEPSMPDSDIARYLLTGRKPTTGEGGSEFSASGALLSLGLSGSEDRAAKLAEKFGIRDLQLGTTQGATGEEAELSGQLSQDLYVRYGRGLGEASNSITFQYRLTPQLMIETISGVENVLDLLYSFNVK
jgi:translocation and assembly module TamB